MHEYFFALEEICSASWEDIGMKAILASFMAVFIELISAIKSLAPILVLLLIAGFILEFWLAWKENNIKSISIFKAMAKIVLYALACLVVGLAAQAITITVGTSCGIDVWFVCLVCVNEALFCLAILAKLGFPVPKWVIEKLQSFNSGPKNESSV